MGVSDHLSFDSSKEDESFTGQEPPPPFVSSLASPLGHLIYFLCVVRVLEQFRFGRDNQDLKRVLGLPSGKFLGTWDVSVGTIPLETVYFPCYHLRGDPRPPVSWSLGLWGQFLHFQNVVR